MPLRWQQSRPLICFLALAAVSVAATFAGTLFFCRFIALLGIFSAPQGHHFDCRHQTVSVELGTRRPRDLGASGKMLAHTTRACESGASCCVSFTTQSLGKQMKNDKEKKTGRRQLEAEGKQRAVRRWQSRSKAQNRLHVMIPKKRGHPRERVGGPCSAHARPLRLSGIPLRLVAAIHQI